MATPGTNGRRYSKREIAFRGLVNCATTVACLLASYRNRSMSITGAAVDAANAISRASGKKFYHSNPVNH
jgi:hypothetical protein